MPFFSTLAILVYTTSCFAQQGSYEDMISQKIMLDIRYFCDDTSSKLGCRQPVTELPPQLAQLIKDTPLAGIILFAENLQSKQQIIRMNYQMQSLAAGYGGLLIATDQEGGRVVRLPASSATGFAGNMAIGATYPRHATEFATRVGEVLGYELSALGFNLNFAPNVDVNLNPANPVINVRSFGEDPQMVATLGYAKLKAMQQQGVIGALKHFPGHGDTHTDSHTGLPMVAHSRAVIDKVDLAPYRNAINQGGVNMIMTAHIQYPELDNTRFNTRNGGSAYLPATMSGKILQGVLRQELGFNGVIVSDALDMAGITKYFTATDALIQTFSAGVDIALMPITIRRPQDIQEFKKALADAADAVSSGRLSVRQMQQSVARIQQLKTSFEVSAYSAVPLSSRLASGVALPHPKGKQIAQALADKAVVQFHNNGVLPLAENTTSLLLVMPDNRRCRAFSEILSRQRAKLELQCLNLARSDTRLHSSMLEQADAVVIADISPLATFTESGGMDGMTHPSQRAGKKQQADWYQQLVKQSREQQKPTVFIALRAPYILADYAADTDASLAAFAYGTSELDSNQGGAEIYTALAKVLFGQITATGSMPVTVR